MRTERQEFRADNNLLYHTICSQAGTLEKALAELVMNSIDAGGSRVDVTLTPTTFSVIDDGRGFTDREEVDSFFATFGTAHHDGDGAIYGQFRMGRGQIMAFTRNRWRSGPFMMHVDIKEMGLTYDLTTFENDIAPGCRIEGELYEPLTPAQVIQTTDALTEMVKYMPIPVYINDVLAAAGCDNMKWSTVTEDAYFLFKPNDYRLAVYNLGVLVSSYPADRFGVGGIVVSRKRLGVNVARNDIKASCPIWKSIQKELRKHSGLAETQRKEPWTENRRARVLWAIVNNDFQSEAEAKQALDAPVFTDITGRHYSISTLIKRAASGREPITVSGPSTIVLRTHESGGVFALSDKVEARSRKDLSETIDRIVKTIESWKSLPYLYDIGALMRIKDRIKPADQINWPDDDDHTPVKEKDLTRAELAVLNSIRNGQYLVAHAMGVKQRALAVYESDTTDGSTDGSTIIWINRKFLTIDSSPGAAVGMFAAIVALLVHEYCHDDDDSKAHGHSAEFYEQFHNIMGQTGRESAVSAIGLMANLWMQQRRRYGLKLRAGDLRTLDIVASVADDTDVAESS